MKNFYSLLILSCFFLNCTNESSEATTTNTTSTTPLASETEADPMYDNSYKGIYKGILIGNKSGSLYINLYNDGQIYAKLQTENYETFDLSNVPIDDFEGREVSPIYRKFRFANENMTFDIKLDDYGNDIVVSDFKFFSDNTLKASLFKETSTSLIKCYTGTFTGQDEIGRVNFTSDEDLKVRGLSMNFHSSTLTEVVGEIVVLTSSDSKSGIDINIDPNFQIKLNANLHFGHISGNLSGYKFDGDWMYKDNKIGSWKATRIL